MMHRIDQGDPSSTSWKGYVAQIHERTTILKELSRIVEPPMRLAKSKALI